MRNGKNVLFVVIDQLRADCLHGALSECVDLPRLNDLKSDAVTFNRHYSVTNPCGPSRASMLTGLYAMNHRSVRNGTPLRSDLLNLATEVRKAGYEPMLFGYNDTSADPRGVHPADPALKTFERPMPGFCEKIEMTLEASYPWRAHLKQRGYNLPEYSQFYVPVSSGERKPKPNDPAFYGANDSDTAFLTDEFLKEISVRTEESWFAHLTYIRPHPPLVAPVPYNSMYRPEDIPPPVRMRSAELQAALHPFIAADLKRDAINEFVDGCERLNNEDDVQVLRSVYLGLATEVDAHVGRVVDFLKETGQYDDTLLVVTSDHGEMLGDFHQWGKMTFFDAAYHTPLIVRDPRRSETHGATVDEFTESVDLAPTILEWIGRPAPTGMNGSSLLPFLEGQRPQEWRVLRTRFRRTGCSDRLADRNRCRPEVGESRYHPRETVQIGPLQWRASAASIRHGIRRRRDEEYRRRSCAFENPASPYAEASRSSHAICRSCAVGHKDHPDRRCQLPPLAWMHPIFGRAAAARQALHSRKSGQRMFSRLHPAASRAVAPAFDQRADCLNRFPAIPGRTRFGSQSGALAPPSNAERRRIGVVCR